eukprot:693253-Amphidinium_carterae.1
MNKRTNPPSIRSNCSLLGVRPTFRVCRSLLANACLVRFNPNLPLSAIHAFRCRPKSEPTLPPPTHTLQDASDKETRCGEDSHGAAQG